VNYPFKANNYIEYSLYSTLYIYFCQKADFFKESGVAYFILLNQKPKIWVVVVLIQ